MTKKNVLLRRVYFTAILTMLLTIVFTGLQVMAATNTQQGKVNWKSDSKHEEIQVPVGVTGDGGTWSSTTYTEPKEENDSVDIVGTLMDSGAENGAIIAALLGVLALSASKSGDGESVPTVAAGNGIWVPESDRAAVIEMINKAASKQYYIDADGFVKEVEGAIENPSKSSTYSSVIDRLINGDNKVVIGVNDGWVSCGEDGLEANAFTDGNSGITIGDNCTPQVVIVTGKDTEESSAEITLAHELTHALRGELGLRSINTEGGVNKDEEAHTIELENKIREELGYLARTDGDDSDGGDGSYGEYSDALEGKDWYNYIDEMQGTTTLSGNPYSYSLLGAIVHAIKSIISSLSGSGSSSKKKKKKKSSSSSSTPAWGSNYDGDSAWDCDCNWDWDCQGDCEWDCGVSKNWNTFWGTIVNNITQSLSDKAKETLSIITGIITKIIPKIVDSVQAPRWVLEDGKWYYLDCFGKKENGWIQDPDSNKWYYMNPDGIMQTGWVKDNDTWYYFDPSGAMQTGWLENPKDGKWYYLERGGEMKTGWFEDPKDHKWYYLDSNGAMKIGWVEYGNNWYYLNSDGSMVTGWMKPGDNWYYLDKNGAMKTGWIKDPEDGNYYYLDSNGAMLTKNWIEDKNKWYYLNSNGVMQPTGWIKDETNGNWYYLDSDNQLKTGWMQENGNWYYLNKDSGKMQTGWLVKDGKWYYFDSNGVMQTGTLTIDDKAYEFDLSGQLQVSDGHVKGLTRMDAAKIAQNVYFTDFKEEENRNVCDGWVLFDHYNHDSLQIGVYKKMVDGEEEYVLACRGSRDPLKIPEHPEYVDDWENNINQFKGNSEDVRYAMLYADYFVHKHPDANITFVGHSKGGPEAIACAVITNKDAIVFNPAAPILTGIDTSNYNGSITAYVVKDEILNTWEGSKEIEKLGGDMVYLPTQYQIENEYDFENEAKNHGMDAVLNALK